MNPDVCVDNQGSVMLLCPLTDAGRDWITENIAPEPWQWLGPNLAIEPRCAPAIVEGMQADGLEVK